MGPSVHNYNQPAAVNVIESPNIMFLADVLQSLRVSRSQLYKLMSEGKAPKPVESYHRKSVWRRDQIEKYLQDKLKGALD
nr:hypothetical protein CKG001_10600 [Bdellovibrio sp. CKG001]